MSDTLPPRMLMWLNYRRNHVNEGTISVPSPYDGDPTVPYWYDKIAGMAADLAANGFTDVLFPNPVMNDGGQAPTMDGYSPYNDYDLGESAPTRFGSVDKLRRAIAVYHANGINVHMDIILHQRMGGANGVYRYPASGGAKLGRFPKNPGCFRATPPRTIPPFVAEDPVPDVPDDYAFGDEFCPVNAVPKDYVWNGLIMANEWLFRATGADGARLDDMKGIAVSFMNAFLSSAGMKDKFFFGEYASGNPNDTDWWVGQVNGKSSAIDFGFHYNMAEPMCMQAGAGTFYMGRLADWWNAMIGSNAMKAVPFVESMDSDTDGFATIVSNKILGYALLLGGQGLPLVYIRDYLKEPDCYGLRAFIDNLGWIHQNLAGGGSIPRYSSDKLYVFERNAGNGLIVALNNDVWNPNWYSVTVQTNWPAGWMIHDYTGNNSENCWVDDQGKITFGIPPGANGMGYGLWAPAGINHPNPVLPRRSTTQYFEGAEDLLTPMLSITMTKIGTIWCSEDTKIELTMQTADGATPNFTYQLQVTAPDGTTITPATSGDSFVFPTSGTGWHTISGMITGTPLPYRLKTTYMATHTLAADQY